MNICAIIDDYNFLHCPSCGGQNLHQCMTTVYTGCEDAKRMMVEIEQDDVNICISDEGNPSSRRNGLKIMFACETCPDYPVLLIYQHKGVTRVEWRSK